MTRRLGQVIGIDQALAEAYVAAHADPPAGVLATIHRCGIRNYSIFRDHDQLFAYFEYVGDDYEADMAAMAADPVTRDWWAFVGPMQRPRADRPAGTWWLTLPEVFHAE